MSTLLTIKTILYNQISTLIKASGFVYAAAPAASPSPYVLKPRTFIVLTTKDSDPRRNITAPADYPQLIQAYGDWDYQDDSSISPGAGKYPGGLYGDQLVADPPVKPIGRPKTLTQGVVLTLTHRDLQAVIDDTLEANLIDAIEANGPNLGIPNSVIPFTQISNIRVRTANIVSRSAQQPPMQGNFAQAQSTFTFTILARWKANTSPTQTVTL
jgi:hypothetical protein